MIPKASLYDRYRLSNSSAIPLFEGDTGNAAIAVGTHLQGLYDTAQQGGNDINAMADNIQAMQADQQLAKELRTHVQSTIGKFSEAKDWENRVGAVRSLGQEYVNRASELAAPIKQYQEWKKGLDDKDKALTSEQRTIYDQMAMAGYSGLRKDATGKYVGGFNGPEISKNINVPERMDKWIKDAVERAGGTDVTTDNGITKYRQAGTWHILDRPTIKRIANAARASDNEYRSYQGMEEDMNAFVGSKIRVPEQLNSLGPIVKYEAEKYMAQGHSLQEATAMAMKNNRRNQIITAADEYAYNKYAHNNQTSINSQEIGDVAKAEAVKKTTDDFRLVGTGVNTVPDWVNDPAKLTTEISNSEQQIGTLQENKSILEKQLATDKGNTQLQVALDRINKQIEGSQKVLDNNKNIWNSTRNQAVIDLKLGDGKGGFITTYDQFVNTRKDMLQPKLKAAFPSGVTLFDGTKISPEQLANAIADGKITSRTKSDNVGKYRTNTLVYDIVLPNGNKKELDIKGGIGNLPKLVSIKNDAYAEVGAVQDRAQKIHKDVVKNYSVKGNAVGLNTEEQRVIGDFGTSSATIYAAPGSNEISTNEDLRGMRFVPEVFVPETGRITGRFKDDKGKLSPPMDIEMNSNIMPELKARLSKNNTGGKFNGVISAMDDESYSGILKKVKPSSVLTGAPDASGLSNNKKPLIWHGKQMELVNNADGPNRQWVLRYKGGDVVIDENGDQYRTESITEADSWLRQMTNQK